MPVKPGVMIVRRSSVATPSAVDARGTLAGVERVGFPVRFGARGISEGDALRDDPPCLGCAGCADQIACALDADTGVAL